MEAAPTPSRGAAYLRLYEQGPAARKRFPEYSNEVVPDGDSTFWAGRYVGPQDRWRQWDRYGIDGILVRSMVTNANATLMDVTGSSFAFVVVDEDGVEDVVILRMPS